MEEFFKKILSNGEGYLGLAFRKEGQNWKNLYYSYPTQLSEAAATITDANSKGWDCYFVPSVLREKSRRKYAFKESHVVWVDYDGSAPAEWPKEPSVVVQTSGNHAHAYWCVDEPLTSIEVEGYNRTMASLSGSDSSGWDCTQLLRIPGTQSIKRDCPVTVLSESEKVWKRSDFPKEWNLKSLLWLREQVKNKPYWKSPTIQNLLSSFFKDETLRTDPEIFSTSAVNSASLISPQELSELFSSLQTRNGGSFLAERIAMNASIRLSMQLKRFDHVTVSLKTSGH